MKDNDIRMKMAMDGMEKEDGMCVETSSPLFQEIWAMVDGDISVGGKRAISEESYPNKIKTQKKEGDGEEANVEADVYDEEASTIEKVNGYATEEAQILVKSVFPNSRCLFSSSCNSCLASFWSSIAANWSAK